MLKDRRTENAARYADNPIERLLHAAFVYGASMSVQGTLQTCDGTGVKSEQHGQSPPWRWLGLHLPDLTAFGRKRDISWIQQRLCERWFRFWGHNRRKSPWMFEKIALGIAARSGY